MRNAAAAVAADVDSDSESDSVSDTDARCLWQEVIFQESQIWEILKALDLVIAKWENNKVHKLFWIYLAAGIFVELNWKMWRYISEFRN